jgi:hypothetical protein
VKGLIMVINTGLTELITDHCAFVLPNKKQDWSFGSGVVVQQHSVVQIAISGH